MKKRIIVMVVIVAAVLGLGFWLMQKSQPPVERSVVAPSNIDPAFTHVPSSTELKTNLTAAGLTALPEEGTKLHIHQHLDIVINSSPIPIPADIGVGADFISPIHVHDDTGIIHVESPEVKDFTLGQFFTEWGIKFDATCLGSYCTDATHALVVAVNGSPINDPRNHVLKAHEEIEIWYGSKNENPKFTSSYDFPLGL